MCHLVETIKVEHGRYYDLPYHTTRMNRSRRLLFGRDDQIDLESCLAIPPDLGPERHKCRVVYGNHVVRVEYEAYKVRPIRSLKIVDGSGIDYHHKYVDRSALAQLRELRAGCDDILIEVSGQLTDGSYANVALFDGTRWYTPATVLLEGTKRARLIDEGILTVADIAASEISSFEALGLINALIDIGECVVPTSSIVP